MGKAILGDILEDWSIYELDDSIYLPSGREPSLELEVNVLPSDPLRKRIFEEQTYMLGIEQVRNAIDGLEKQLGRKATRTESLRAVVHYAQHDAFINPQDAIDQ